MNRSKKYKAYYQTNVEKIGVQQKAYYQANKEKIKAYKKVYRFTNREKIKACRLANKDKKKVYRQANAEKIKAHDKVYRQVNKEKMKVCQKAYRQANPEKVRICKRKYRQANPEKIRLGARKRQALKLGVGHIPYTDKQIFERDGYVCQLCGNRINMKLKHPNSLSASIDHIIPVSKGGADAPINIQAAHLGCNILKHAGAGGQLRLFG